MAWIESHQSLGAHPKTKKLARLLNAPIPQVIGHLHMLWWWALDYAQDGSLARYQVEDIADAVLWEGSATLLVSALLDAGFLEHIDGHPAIHDWPEYGGKLIAKRKADADRKARAANREALRATSDGTPTEPPRQSQVEKRREEKSTEEETTDAYFGVVLPVHLRDFVKEHCEAIGTRNLNTDDVEGVLELYQSFPLVSIRDARKKLRSAVPRRLPYAHAVREILEPAVTKTEGLKFNPPPPLPEGVTWE